MLLLAFPVHVLKINMFNDEYILLSLPIGTVSVERSFSQMKIIETRLRNRLSDATVVLLMRIAIEGPDQTAVSFDAILDVFKENNHRFQF